MSVLRDAVLVFTGMRKFIIMILLVIVGIVFRILDYINGVEFVDLLEGTAIAYFAANGGEHITKAVIEWARNKVS